MPRLVVTGAGGQVGTELVRLTPPQGWEIAGFTRAEADIADPTAIARLVEGADVLVNAAAYTAVDKAEEEREAAYRVNATAPGLLAESCAARGIPLIHISTDYVFDGSKTGAYLPDDPVAPLGVYGASKEEGERLVRAALPQHIILRTSWVYAAHGRNFVKTMLRLGAERDSLRVVADQHGAPTAAGDIAAAILAIAEKLLAGSTAYGTYHYSAAGLTTWHGLAEAIFELSEPYLGKHPSVEPIPTSAYPTPARRPVNSALDCSNTMATFAPPRRDWSAALADVLAEIRATANL
ncbi:MAG: dTDP-4-dehydrorhamnose reductase [Alphaproteobacteria bacterium]|nr:dTDP-4-dehydrorhamnose reductase [Alphaproteobacteria bacterium]MBU0799139.1 dTDP-4-dehydrorhamnose reductase [Alphaproteobacteria bacterium]MBU0888832.1 dTDP-4-dehydrorhamnose reductase [Alphaproteobacteria bacterium]MBU1813852.1 dTDP-4-dehydrorhamnose reductase [Alphaproteobacteria bacterium]